VEVEAAALVLLVEVVPRAAVLPATWPFPGYPVLLLRKRPHPLPKTGVTLK
jgi:hypothetical protein